MISFKNVSIGYPSSPLFDIGEIELQLGKVYILVGKNGAGKSTFLKSITKQEKLLKGKIRIERIDIEKISEKELSKRVALVRSTFPSVDYLNVFDYIALGRSPYTNAFGRLSVNDIAAVNDAINALDITHLKNEFTSDISDGERQLVSIAKAIAQETPIILLDEPTAFLDYSNKMMVLEVLKRLAVNLNKCIILSSHDIDLSIASQCPFILIETRIKEMNLVEGPVEKNTLLQKAFS